MLVMSYLLQDQLPFSLPAADISIVTIASGVEGYLVPCKFYSYLAAGNAVIGICNSNCEVADIINNEQCGKVVALGDSVALVDSILQYYENDDILKRAKINSRNVEDFIKVINFVLENKSFFIEKTKCIEEIDFSNNVIQEYVKLQDNSSI